MNHPGLAPDTIERILRGHDAGPPKLAGLLAAISCDLTVEDATGEEAAITAFRAAHSRRSGQPSVRRFLPLVSVKTALIGLVLLLSGGVAMAATARHLPNPLGNRHSDHTRTPATSDTFQTRTPPGIPSRPAPDRQTLRSAHPATSHSRPMPPKKNKARTTKEPNGKATKKTSRKPTTVPSPAPTPPAGSRHPANHSGYALVHRDSVAQ
jgi:hypothetical protein